MKVPSELISYPIVTSASIWEFTLIFRNAEYYYQFFWPQVLMIYTPIFIALVVAIYKLHKNNFFKNNLFKLAITALIPVLILAGIVLSVLKELTESFSPDIFFKNYLFVIIILSFVWIVVVKINNIFNKNFP